MTDKHASPTVSAAAEHVDSEPRSRPRGTALRDAVRVVAAVAMLFAAAFAPSVVLAQPSLSWLNEPDAPLGVGVAVLVGAYGIALVTALVLVLIARAVERRGRPVELGLRFDLRAIGLLLAALGATVVVVLAVGLPLQSAGWLRAENAGLGEQALWAVIVVGLARAFLLQGVGEELIFRGYLQSSLERRPVTAVVVAALSFGALHLISSGGQQSPIERVVYLALPIGFALFAGALRLRCRSVWPAVGVHAGLHVGLLIATLLGVGNGPALWVGIGVVTTAVAVVILRHSPTGSGPGRSAP